MATAIFFPPPILPPPPAPEQPLSFFMSFAASPQALQTPPVAFVTISIRENYLVVARERSGRSYVDDEHTEVVHMMTYQVPLGSMFSPHSWKQTVSVILADYRLLLGREAYARLFSLLCSQAPAKAADAYRRGFTRLDVALDVVHRVAVDRLPPPRRRGRRAQVPVPAPPPQVLEDDSSLEARETSHPDEEEELCSICLEELREDDSRKTVTRTPCAHLFHSECLLPWLNDATTCPLCRTSLF